MEHIKVFLEKMEMEIDVKRINELARKSKAEGLTDAEKEEQAALRRAYVDSVKANLRAQLDNTYIKKETGEIVRLSVRSEDDSDTE